MPDFDSSRYAPFMMPGEVEDGDPQAECDLCGDSGYVDDPGPQDGCIETEAFCMCPAGRAAKRRANPTPAQVAARYYDPYRHDPDSIGFDDSYSGPSELELGGGCTRCGAPDDCYCNG